MTVFLFVNTYATSVENVITTEAEKWTTEIPKTPTETPVVTEAKIGVNKVDESDANVTSASKDIDIITAKKVLTPPESTESTVSMTDSYQNGSEENVTERVITDSSSTAFGDVAEREQKNEAHGTVTSEFKVEMKTESLEQVETNTDKSTVPQTSDIVTEAVLKVEHNKSNETRFDVTQFINLTYEETTNESNFTDETSTFSQPADIPLLLKALISHHLSKNNFTMKENTSYAGIENFTANVDKIPANQLFEWLDRIKPNRTDTKSSTVTVKDVDIDTRIITTDKLMYVIGTICGSFVLFVVILIVVSCCRRNRNARTDSEKSGTSEFSVVSTSSIGTYEKQSSTKSRSDSKNDYNDVFMGIPTNNAIWKDLSNLPDTASCVMPESTKL